MRVLILSFLMAATGCSQLSNEHHRNPASGEGSWESRLTGKRPSQIIIKFKKDVVVHGPVKGVHYRSLIEVDGKTHIEEEGKGRKDRDIAPVCGLYPRQDKKIKIKKGSVIVADAVYHDYEFAYEAAGDEEYAVQLHCGSYSPDRFLNANDYYEDVFSIRPVRK